MTFSNRAKIKKKPPPAFDSGIVSEPLLFFGGRHEHIDPKTGLSLYGPYTPAGQIQSSLSSIKVGIIGTPPMIGDAELWLEACKGKLENDGSQPFLYPHFPGFNGQPPFCCELIFGETWHESILDNEVTAVLEPTNFFARVSNVVELYKDKIETLSQRDPQPDVILCCIPQDIIDQCTTYLDRAKEKKRIKVSKAEKKALKIAASGQKFLWPWMDPTLGIEGEEFGHQNLRRGLKAQAMPFGIPTQIVWPRTLQLVPSQSKKKSERPTQDIATRAWNFTTALYHKAGATPWRLSQIDPTVCFVGISFYREIGTDNPKLRTSLSQTFTAAGDGYVLRGTTFEWDKPGVSPHLDESSAAALIRDVLELYQRHNRGSLPTRIVVHKSSRYWKDELMGFQDASKHIPRKDLIAFGSRGIQFYRGGDYPPLRGTFVKFSDSNFILYTSGYIPFLRSYPGPRVPMPLEILEHHGDTPWTTLLKEIISLTKMNWNTADFACGEPITTAFASRVGQIMAEIPEDVKPRAEYRFYM
jgi:hypothetical protein